MNTKEMIESLTSNKQTINETIISKKNLRMMIDEIVDLLLKASNKGIEKEIRNKHIWITLISKVLF